MLNLKNFFDNRYWRSRLVYPLISLVTALSLCLTIPSASYGFSLLDILIQGAQIIQLSNISDSQEVSLGKKINQQLISQEIKLYRNPQVNQYVNRIGQRLAAKSTRKKIPYTFQVVQDDSINAFATTGGFVYLNTGLIKAADNEAELASVIGHEMGHIEGDHLINQMRKSAIAQGLATVAGVEESKLVQIGVDLAYRRPNSRQAEFDADQRGLKTLKSANYAPSAMVSFMKKLQSKGGGVPTFLSTHPATGDRVNSLQRQISQSSSQGNDGLSQSAYKSNIRPLL